MEIQVHIGAEIKRVLNEQKRSVAWLAEEIDCDNSGLGRRLQNQHINTKLLYKISFALKNNFFEYCAKAFTDTKQRKL